MIKMLGEIVPGKPEVNCERLANADVEFCSNACMASDSCVAVQLDDSECRLCNYSTQPNIRKCDAQKVAIKMTVEGDECPTYQRPIFDNLPPISAKLTIGNRFVFYSFRKFNETIYANTFSNPWAIFTRKSGRQVYYGAFCAKQLKRIEEAMGICAHFGAALAGIESRQEIEFIVDALPINATIWLGAERPSNCDADCGHNGFEWSETTISGYDVVEWASGYPLESGDCISWNVGDGKIRNHGCIFDSADSEAVPLCMTCVKPV
ncbi:unnamed protein product [Caenorhabditis bovis]|uniref:C-type lectin domain-containing protein n=1 Tax=Caenorhabditis bovis TaxID=2654633 RepID=A0A8S1ELV7_9PELO|nr:unnamed protein product [Caenorhabditis bovis]